jgi:hypothetical protein
MAPVAHCKRRRATRSTGVQLRFRLHQQCCAPQAKRVTSMSKSFLNFLMAMKDYIEESECALHRPHDPFWALDEAIAKHEMPEIYYDVLDQLTAFRATASNSAAEAA